MAENETDGHQINSQATNEQNDDTSKDSSQEKEPANPAEETAAEAKDQLTTYQDTTKNKTLVRQDYKYTQSSASGNAHQVNGPVFGDVTFIGTSPPTEDTLSKSPPSLAPYHVRDMKQS
jgi:hypothetical protein